MKKVKELQELQELQESSERYFNELKDKINEQKEYFTKESKTLKKNQTNSEAEDPNTQDEGYIRKH